MASQGMKKTEYNDCKTDSRFPTCKKFSTNKIRTYRSDQRITVVVHMHCFTSLSAYIYEAVEEC